MASTDDADSMLCRQLMALLRHFVSALFVSRGPGPFSETASQASFSAPGLAR